MAPDYYGGGGGGAGSTQGATPGAGGQGGGGAGNGGNGTVNTGGGGGGQSNAGGAGGNGGSGIVILRYLTSDVNLGDGLISHYEMNDTDGTTVVDSSGNTNDGTGTYTASSTGKINGSLSFDGISNFVELPTDLMSPIGTGPFSVAYWLYVIDDSGVEGGRAPPISGYDAGFFNRIEHGYFTIGLTAAVDVGFPNLTYLTGEWNHIVITRSGNSLKAYKNNELIVDESDPMWATSIGSSGQGYRLARMTPDSITWFLNAKLDDFRIYDKALSPYEISAVYNGGAGTELPLPPNTTPNIPTLVSPANALITTDNTPTLSAVYSDSDADDVGTTNYRISSGTAQNCLDGVSIANSGTSTETITNNATTTYTPGSTIGSDGTYYWCAQNNDGVATSTWTSMGNFILDTTNPVVTVTSPTNGSYSTSTSVSFAASQSDTNAGFLVPNLDSSLLSWWRMDDVDGSGNPTDYIGSNNGTKQGNAAQTNSGKAGKAFTFDGTGDYIDVAAFAGIPAYNEGTISFWVNLDRWTAYDNLFGFQSGATNNNGFRLEWSASDRVDFVSGSPGGSVSTLAIPGISTGSWFHFALTWNKTGNTASGYINGSGTTGAITNWATTYTAARIGTGYLNRSIDGSMDEVQIYNRALTADEITALYNGTAIDHSSTLSEGSHTYKAYTSDLAGNVASSSLSTFTVDATAPNAATSLTWTESSPASSTSVTASWTKSNSADLNNQKIQFYTGGSCNTVSGSLIDLASNSVQTRAFTGVDATTYTYKITSIDTAVNETVSACSAPMSIDTSAPTRSGGAPSGTLDLNTSSTTISLSTNENATCKYSVSSETAYADMTAFTTTGEMAHSKVIEGLENAGSYVYYVKCSDAIGNTNSSEFTISFTVQADVNAPTVSVTAPANNGIIHGSSVSVTANAVDDVSVVGVQFKLDTNTNIGAEDTSSPYGVTLDTTSLDDGTHTIIAVARDGTGNQATSSTITVTVDNTVPVVNAGTNKVRNAIFDQNATASDATTAIASYLWSKVSGPGAITFGSGTAEDTTVTADTYGDYVLKLTVVDSASNSASSTFSLVWDNLAPTVSVTAPLEGATVYGGSVSVTASAVDDDSTVAGVQFKLDTNTNIGAEDILSPYSIAWDSTGVSDGNHTITAVARDDLGNTATSTVITVTVDNSTPIISNILPTNNSNIVNFQTITFTTDEVADCRLSLTQESYDNMSDDVSCSVSNGILMSCSSPNLGGAGIKNIYLACNDSLDNKDTADSATHLTYTIQAHGRSSNIGGGSTAVSTTTPTYSISINSGAGETSQRIVSLQFTATPPESASAVVISTSPDFANVTTIPYSLSTYQYDLCQESTVCPDGNYTIYTKFLSPTGVSSPIISSSITLNAVPLLTEVTNNITDLITNITTPLVPNPEENTVVFPSVNEVVPETAQETFQGTWPMAVPTSMGDFVFENLPESFQVFVNKFPEIGLVLQEVGIDRTSDILALSTVGGISIPSLSEVIGLSEDQGLAISDFSSRQINSIPTDAIFVRTMGESIDLNTELSVSNEGFALQTLNTTVGQPLKFVVRPEGEAKKVSGYMIFRSAQTSALKLNHALLIGGQAASVIDALNVADEPSSDVDLVLNKFDYVNSGNGLWTAEVTSPLALGQYELKTVVDYKEKAKAPKTISMVVVVDPEGYVYKMSGDAETRINNALVSIYWLNPKTSEYELWSANIYRQENPQTTDVTGRYSFLVPQGDYYLEVKADGYSSYKSEPFKVEESKGVFINIEMKTKWSFLGVLNLQTILLGIVVILLGWVLVVTVRKRKSIL